MRRKARLNGLIALGVLLAATITSRAQTGKGEWPAYGADKASTKYSPLDQINKDNVRNLRIVWRQPATPLEVRKQGVQAPSPVNYVTTPLMVGGLLYMATGFGTVAALNPATGAVVWFVTPLQGELRAPTRGLAYWAGGNVHRAHNLVSPQF